MSYHLLNWEDVCDRAPLIAAAHESASARAEYGISWQEFINTDFDNKLGPMAKEWWDSLTKDRQRVLLTERLEAHKKSVDAVSKALGDLEAHLCEQN